MNYSFGCLALLAVGSLFTWAACGPAGDPARDTKDSAAVHLITLDPGHFHAALVQKKDNPQIAPAVHIYAPGGKELESHLALIKQYNERPEDPTHWDSKVYTGADFFEKMLSEKKGNVLVLAGNNRNKTGYISKGIEAGINVLADKPMAITSPDFNLLVEAFAHASQNGLLLYDIMTERSEITNLLQKEIMHLPAIFGELQSGTPEDPAIRIESVHYFFKQVSGKPLFRPAWFFDPTQQGEPVADVGTHLVDLVQWQAFPEKTIDYQQDIRILSSSWWPTPLTLEQFKAITQEEQFPAFLSQYVTGGGVLETHANGEVNYTLNGKHVKIIARWDYQAREGGDTHNAIYKGSKANLEIRQGREEQFKPVLYIIPVKGVGKDYAEKMKQSFLSLAEKYPGIALEEAKDGWKVVIPAAYNTGHEAHFGEVMDRYLDYLQNGNMPAWEVPNMIAKYYLTTRAVELAQRKDAASR